MKTRFVSVAAMPGAVLLAAMVLSAGPLASHSARAAPLPEATPESVGLSSARLARIADTLKADIDRGRLPGAVVAVARRGKLAYFQAFGFRDKAAGTAMTTDTIFSIASMTKPMTSIAIMSLYEQGRLFISDPVGKFLSPLAKMPVAVIRKGEGDTQVVETVPALRPVSLQDLLRHTSGITYGARGTTPVHKMYPPSSAGSSNTYTAAEFVEKLGGLPLLHQPGTVWDYSLSTDVLGLVVEAVSGQTLGEYLDGLLWKPLAMTDTGFLVPEAKRARYAKSLDKDPDSGRPLRVLDSTKPTKFQCGGGCAVSTAGDYIRFAQMLLAGGQLDGTRIVSRKTIEYMTADHLGPEIENTIARTDPSRQGYGFGLGFAVRRSTGIPGVIGSAGDYNWGGAYGTYFWIDPKEDMAVVFMAHAPGPIRLHYRKLMTTLVHQAIAD